MNDLRRITPRLNITTSAFDKPMDLFDLLIIEIQYYLTSFHGRKFHRQIIACFGGLTCGCLIKIKTKNINKIKQHDIQFCKFAAVGGV